MLRLPATGVAKAAKADFDRLEFARHHPVVCPFYGTHVISGPKPESDHPDLVLVRAVRATLETGDLSGLNAALDSPGFVDPLAPFTDGRLAEALLAGRTAVFEQAGLRMRSHGGTGSLIRAQIPTTQPAVLHALGPPRERAFPADPGQHGRRAPCPKMGTCSWLPRESPRSSSVHYGFVSDTPRLTIVHVLDDPKLAFDVFRRPESVGERASNRLKQVLQFRRSASPPRRHDCGRPARR